MNIVLSSAMLAIALLMVAHSISELKPKQEQDSKLTEPVNEPRRLLAKVPADWNRIMMETKLEKTGRKK